jgi:hypothetical protein
MRLSEIIRSLRGASLAEKSGATIAGVTAQGEDVRLPYVQAGWVNVADSQYTQGAPLAVASGVKTQITIDGLGVTTNKSYADGLHQDVWSGNRLKPDALGEAYNVRLSFTTAQAGSGSNHYITILADIGTDVAPVIIAEETFPILQGQGVPTLVVEAFQFFCLDTFGKNGCRLFVRPSVDITMYGAAIFIQRTFKP